MKQLSSALLKALKRTFLARSVLFRRAIGLMDRNEKVAAGVLVLLMLAFGLVETTITAMVFPIVYGILEPDKLMSIPLMRTLMGMTGGGSPRHLFQVLVAIAVTLLAISSAASMAIVYFSERHANRCVARVTRQCVERYVEAPYLWSLKRNPTMMQNQIYSDVMSWRTGFVGAQLAMVQSMVLILAPTSVAIVIAPYTALIAILLLAVFCLLTILFFRRHIRRVAERVRKLRLSFSKSMYHVVAGVREMKVSGEERYFIDSYDRDYRRSLTEGVKARLLSVAPGNILRLLGQVSVLVFALVLVAAGTSGTDLAAFLALLGVIAMRVMPAAGRIVDDFVGLSRSAPATAGLLRFLDESQAAIEGQSISGGGRPLPRRWQMVEVDQVSFRYPDAPKPTLQQVSIRLEFGKCYGFVGRSGSGKSTLLNVLLGLIRPSQGVVRVDDVPLAEADARSWHRRFGYVPQDPYILDASLRENVTLGRPAEDADVLTALERAGLGDVVARLPKGIHTKVAERSRQLSGGEMQRAVLARALFRNPEILYLDEATSALDSLTESEVYGSIKTLRGRAMTMLVTHRVSSLRVCDCIFVMRGGRIVASGTFDELLVACDDFRQLVNETDMAGSRMTIDRQVV